MQNPKLPVDQLKNYQYNCKYGTKRPSQAQKPIKPSKMKQKQDIQYEFKETSITNSSNKTNLEEELSHYEQPTLPYYVVPVLYVPKRVLPNDEIQPTTNYRPQTRPATNPKTKYYTKTYNPSEYSAYNEYYQKREEVPLEPTIEDEMSYYNMQFCDSSRSVKEEAFEGNYQDYNQFDQACSFVQNKPTSENIKPLKSQPLCHNYNPDKKFIKEKSRSSYECTERRPVFDSEYYYMDKELYYGGGNSIKKVPRTPTECCYYQQDLASDTDFDITTYEGNEPNVAKNLCGRNVEGKVKGEEKCEVKVKTSFERSTQTLMIKPQSATTSTQTGEVKVCKDDRTIPVSRNKCNLLRENNNDILDEADKELVDTLYKLQALKQSRRSTSKKEFPEQRLASPGRRKM